MQQWHMPSQRELEWAQMGTFVYCVLNVFLISVLGSFGWNLPEGPLWKRKAGRVEVAKDSHV